jgi:hypothetical protein
MEFYLIVLECISTGEVEESRVFLHRRDYRSMRNRINEVVYVDNNKEWALKEITKIK